jgi:protein Tex
MNPISILQQTLGLPEKSINNTLSLLESGATIPFIARYRKEQTGNLDEVQIFSIQKEYQKIIDLEKRRESILQSIEEQGKLTPDLKSKILQAKLMSELEDLYLPYKPQKRSKAQLAILQGLEPFANWIMKQTHGDVSLEAERYLSDEVKTVKDAINGALEILSSKMAEDIFIRNYCREQFEKHAILHSKKKRGEREGEMQYKDYFDFNEKLVRCPAHRILACFRGEKEGFLNLEININEEFAIERIERKYVRGHHESSEYIKKASEMAYDNHLQPQMESEFRDWAKEKADKESIAIFGTNLKQLLLAPPLGHKRIMGIDPGFRTGCKVVCIDEIGNLLYNTTIYPHPPQLDILQAEKIILENCAKYKIEAIAIGNGTAGRESEDFVNNINFGSEKPMVFMVNESGASIYSASAEGREEFPNHDVTVRGAVSIARRLMDPLAELVKIDPKSIGVGQYQHDVNQTMLKEELAHIVESAVNSVGVDLNTASKWLLKHVAGVGPTLAQNIVDYRTQNGKFTSRAELNKVSRLGDKVYEQCAGFLRIRNAKNILDNTAVHPESYGIVEKMAKSMNVTVAELVADKELQKKINLSQFITEKIGMATLNDIKMELAKPGRDPRASIERVAFDKNIRKIEDIKIGMTLEGLVTNITNFGAFVNIGIKNEGLVHVSEMSHNFIKDPNEVVHLNQKVNVKVIDIDIARNRIQLSMKQ